MQENFLNADVLAGRLRAVGHILPAGRLAVDAGKRHTAAVHASSLVATLADALRDKDASG